MVLERFVSARLEGYLNAYFKEFNSNNLSISAFGGNVKLQNLRLKESVLSDAGLPFSIVDGHVGKVNIQITWGSLVSREPIIVEVEDVFVLVEPIYDYEFTEEDERRRKEGRIQQYEASERQLLESFSSMGDGMGSSPDATAEMITLIAKLTEKIRVTVRNVHIRIEDTSSNLHVPMYFGMLFRSFTFESTTDAWELSDLSNENNYVHKYMNLSDFSVYWDCQLEASTNQGLARSSTTTIQEAMKQMIDATSDVTAEFITAGRSRIHRQTYKRHKVPAPPIRQWLVLPFSTSAKIAVRTKGDFDLSSPIIMIESNMSELYVRLDGYQYHGMLSVLDSMSRQAVIYQYRHSKRPLSTVREAPKQWLQYAYRAVAMDVERNKMRWDNIKRYCAIRREYISLYRVVLQERGEGRLATNSASEKQNVARLKELEDNLCTPDLILYRKIALRQFAEELAHAAALAKTKTTKQASGGWFSGWWGAGASVENSNISKKALEVQNDENDLRMKMRQAIDIEGDTNLAHVTTYPDHYIATRLRMNAGALHFVLLTQPDTQPLIHTSAEGMQTCAQLRPNVQGLDISYSLRTFSVHDTVSDKTANVFPELISVQCDENEDVDISTTPVLSFSIATNAEGSTADMSVKMRTRKIQAVYNPYTVASILKILQPPADLQLDEFAVMGEETLDHLARQSQGYLIYYSENRTTLDVDVNYEAPLLLIPEIPSGHTYVATDSPSPLCMVAVDLGGICVTSKLADTMVKSKSDNLGDHLTDDQLYDSYILDLSNVQVLLLPCDMDYPATLKQATLHPSTKSRRNTTIHSTTMSGRMRNMDLSNPTTLRDRIENMIGKVSESVNKTAKRTAISNAYPHLLRPTRARLVVQTCVQPTSLVYTSVKVRGDLMQVDLHISDTKIAKLMKIMNGISNSSTSAVLLPTSGNGLNGDGFDGVETDTFYSANSSIADKSAIGDTLSRMRPRRGLGWRETDLVADMLNTTVTNTKRDEDKNTKPVELSPEEEKMLVESTYLSLVFVLGDVNLRIDEGMKEGIHGDRVERRTKTGSSLMAKLSRGRRKSTNIPLGDSAGNNCDLYCSTKRQLLLCQIQNFEVRFIGRKFDNTLKASLREIFVRNMLATSVPGEQVILENVVPDAFHYLVKSGVPGPGKKRMIESENWNNTRGVSSLASYTPLSVSMPLSQQVNAAVSSEMNSTSSSLKESQILSLSVSYMLPTHPDYLVPPQPCLGLIAVLQMEHVSVNVHRESVQPLVKAMMSLANALDAYDNAAVNTKSDVNEGVRVNTSRVIRASTSMAASRNTTAMSGWRRSLGRTDISPETTARKSVKSAIVGATPTDISFTARKRARPTSGRTAHPDSVKTPSFTRASDECVAKTALPTSDSETSPSHTPLTAPPPMYISVTASFEKFSLKLATQQVVLMDMTSSGFGATAQTNDEGTLATITIDDFLIQDLSMQRGGESESKDAKNEYTKVLSLRESDQTLFDLRVEMPSPLKAHSTKNPESSAKYETKEMRYNEQKRYSVDSDCNPDVSVQLRMTGVNVIFLNRFVTDLSAYLLDFSTVISAYRNEMERTKQRKAIQPGMQNRTSDAESTKTDSKASRSLRTRHTISTANVARSSTDLYSTNGNSSRRLSMTSNVINDDKRQTTSLRDNTDGKNLHSDIPIRRKSSATSSKRERNSSLKSTLSTTISQFDLAQRRLLDARMFAEKIDEKVYRDTENAQDVFPMKLKLDVQVVAPTIVIPRGTYEVPVVVADLGVFSVTNTINKDSLGHLNDTIKVKFTGMSVWSDEIETSNGRKNEEKEDCESMETILSSTDIGVTILRKLGLPPTKNKERSEQFEVTEGIDRGMENHFDVTMAMETLELLLSDRQYYLLLQILDNNLREEGVMKSVGSVSSAPTAGAQSTTNIFEAKTTTGESSTTVTTNRQAMPFAFRFNIKAVTIGLFLYDSSKTQTKVVIGDLDSVSSSSLFGKDKQKKNVHNSNIARRFEFSRMWIRNVAVNVEGDEIITGQASVGQIDIDDVRVHQNTQREHEFDFKSVFRVKKDDVSSDTDAPRVILVSIRQDMRSMDQFVDITVTGVQLFFYPDYAADLLRFITPPSSTATITLTHTMHDGKSVSDTDDLGEHVESFIIGQGDVSNATNALNSTSVGLNKPQTYTTSQITADTIATGTLKVSLTVSRSEIILLEDRRSESTRAILGQANLEMKGRIGNGITNVDVEFYDARLQSCILRRRKQTLMDMIKPFSASITYSQFVPSNPGTDLNLKSSTKAFIEMDDIVCNATYEELAAISNMFIQAVGGGATSGFRGVGKARNSEKLLARVFYGKIESTDTWYTSTSDIDALSMATSSIGSRGPTEDLLGEQFLDVYEHLNIRPFSITFILWQGVNEVQQMPLLMTQVHLDAHACNWSRDDTPIATANTRVECKYFNQKKGTSWETVIEPWSTTLSLRPYSLSEPGTCVILDSKEMIEVSVSSALVQSMVCWSEAIVDPVSIYLPDITYDWIRTTSVPCKLYNDLGLDVTYSYNGQSHQLSASDDMFLQTDKKGKDDQSDDTIDVLVEGFEPLLDIPISAVGVSQYTLVPLREPVDNDDNSQATYSSPTVKDYHMRLACDVTVEDQFKRVELRSTLQVFNNSTLSLDLGCETKVDVQSEIEHEVISIPTQANDTGTDSNTRERKVKTKMAVMAVVAPGDYYNIPLNPAYLGTLRVRPTGFGYTWGEEGLSWNEHNTTRFPNIVPSKHKHDRLFKASEHQTCFRDSSTDNDNIREPTRQFCRLSTSIPPPSLAAIPPVAYPYPRQTIMFNAPVRITNWLPHTIRIVAKSRKVKRLAYEHTHDHLNGIGDNGCEGVNVTVNDVDLDAHVEAKPGATVSLYDVDTHSAISLFLRDLGGHYKIKKAFRVPPIPSKTISALSRTTADSSRDGQPQLMHINATDENDAKIVFVAAVSVQSGVRDIRIYCPYWITNRTGLALAFKDSRTSEKVIVPSESSEPTLFSYTNRVDRVLEAGGSNDVNDNTARISVVCGGNAVGHTSESDCEGSCAGSKTGWSMWSDAFSLDMPGTNGAVTLLPKEGCHTSNLCYDLAVQITMANSISRLITVKPRFVMCNFTDFELEIAATSHTNFVGLIGTPAVHHRATIKAKEEAPWFRNISSYKEGYKNESSLVQVRFTGQTTWTAPFDMSQPDDIVLRVLHVPSEKPQLPVTTDTQSNTNLFVDTSSTNAFASTKNGKSRTYAEGNGVDDSGIHTNMSEDERILRQRAAGAVSVLLRVQILAVAGVLNVIYTVVKGAAPMLIENRCINSRNQLVVRQTDCTTSYTVMPGTSLPYIFDSPTLPRSLQWSIPDQGTAEQLVDFEGKYYHTVQLPNNTMVYAMVIPDAASRIILVTDEQDIIETAMRNVYGIKITDSLGGASMLRMGRTDEFVMEVSLSIRGVGLSLLDLSPHEVAYIAVTDLNTTYNQTTFHQTVECSIGDVQVDYQGIFTVYPVVVSRDTAQAKTSTAPRSGDNSDDEDAYVNARPIFEITVVKHNNPKRPELLQFKYIGLLLQPLNIAMDSSFLRSGMEWANSIWPERSTDTEDATVLIPSSSSQLDSADQLALKAEVEAGVPLYIDVLELHPISMYLSFTIGLDGAEQEQLDVGIMALIGAVGNVVGTLSDIERSPLRLEALLIENLSADSTVLAKTIEQHFTSQAVRQVYSILGSAKFLGNPVRLFNTMGTGVKSFFYEPYKAISRSPLEFGVGLAKGSSALVSHTIGGVTSSLSTVGFTIGKGLANVSFDRKFQRDRQMLLAGKPRSLGKAVKKGGIALVQGLYGGATGIVLQPLSGVEQGGMQGLLAGCGRGVIGIFAKPLSGVVDFGSNLIAAVALSIDPNFYGGQTVRVRYPRHIPLDRRVTSYDPYQADGAWYLKRYRRGSCRSFTYVYHIVACQSTISIGKSAPDNSDTMYQVAVFFTLERLLVFARPKPDSKHSLKINIKIEQLRNVAYSERKAELLLTHVPASRREGISLQIKEVRVVDWMRLRHHLANTPYERFWRETESAAALEKTNALYMAAKLPHIARKIGKAALMTKKLSATSHTHGASGANASTSAS